jgi:endogenous inhibitor of DNA gyrase (YacG/DUF329 family)
MVRVIRVYCPRCKSKEVDKSNTAARYGICSRNSRVVQWQRQANSGMHWSTVSVG